MAYEALFQASLCIQNNEWTKNTLAEIPTCKGVLLFTDSSGRAIQLLQAANLRRTALAKLALEEDESNRRKVDVSGLTEIIYYTCCYNNFLSQLTYTQLAHTIFDKNAVNWVQLPKVSLAAIDTDSFLPYFYVSDSPAAHHAKKKYGLFPTRKTAAEFCEILNTAFVLCRNPSLLKSGRERSCPYLQMQTCPGPCINPDQIDSYFKRIPEVPAGPGRTTLDLKGLYGLMQDAANAMDFEKANELKKRINLLKKLLRPDFQYVHPLEELCFLHIDIGPKTKIEGHIRKRRQFMWFKVTSQGAFHLGEFDPDTENSIAKFLDANWFPNNNPLPLKDNEELLPIVSLQLYRSQRSGTWIDCSQGIRMDAIITGLNDSFSVEFPKNA